MGGRGVEVGARLAGSTSRGTAARRPARLAAGGPRRGGSLVRGLADLATRRAPPRPPAPRPVGRDDPRGIGRRPGRPGDRSGRPARRVRGAAAVRRRGAGAGGRRSRRGDRPDGPRPDPRADGLGQRDRRPGARGRRRHRPLLRPRAGASHERPYRGRDRRGPRRAVATRARPGGGGRRRDGLRLRARALPRRRVRGAKPRPAPPAPPSGRAGPACGTARPRRAEPPRARGDPRAGGGPGRRGGRGVPPRGRRRALRVRAARGGVAPRDGARARPPGHGRDPGHDRRGPNGPGRLPGGDHRVRGGRGRGASDGAAGCRAAARQGPCATRRPRDGG